MMLGEIGLGDTGPTYGSFDCCHGSIESLELGCREDAASDEADARDVLLVSIPDVV